MKRLIPLAILSITMALPTFLTSCSSDDELLTANYQLVYSGSYESTGVIYSFTKHEGGLYSVIDTELCVNKSVIIKYLNEHYSLVSGAGSDDENIQYLFTTPDKSTVITTLKVSDECFNVSYSFVTH